MTEEQAIPPVAAVPETPSLSSTRSLIGTSFDLLGRSGREMRRASFNIGAIVLGTAGPLALATWAIEVLAWDLSLTELDRRLVEGGAVVFGLLASLAGIGVLVATVESRNVAMAILGGRFVGRPPTVRQALARSRMTFWRTVVAAIIVAIPIGIVQSVLSEGVSNLVGLRPDDIESEFAVAEVSFVTSSFVSAIVGAPFAYVLAGVVLGDVDPFEAVRRSFRVFRARKLAAVVVAGFEAIALLLVVFGLSAGLDIAIRVFEALGLGPDAGPLGLAITTAGIVVTVFAFGTLLFTVYALTVAPQAVMFVGLTHATFGLDHVRPGGAHDPDGPRTSGRRFRWITWPMLVGFAVGIVGLAATVALYAPG